jgi:acyl-CoA reductase-like NAD-dependent aldehyde dehydrogenase
MSRIWPLTEQIKTCFIHGRFITKSQHPIKALINPANKKVYASVQEATIEHVEEAVLSSKKANDEWSKYPNRRRDCMLALADKLEKNEHDMASIEAIQTGKPMSDALFEINDVVDCIRHFAGYSDKIFGQAQQLPDYHAYTTREPLGTVSLITSYNYPLLLTGWKLAPALAAGNCAIVKPAPQTPLSTLALADLSKDILPPGVLNVLMGTDPDISRALIDKTDKTSFTGSTPTGQDIMRRAADRLTPLTLECGGKNAVIVFDDADLKSTIELVAMGAFSNAGQNCCAISRVLVHQSIYSEFVKELKKVILDTWKPTFSMDDQSNLYGPLIDDQQYKRVKSIIEQCPLEPEVTGEEQVEGYFIPPTVYTNVPDDADIARREIFGPVLSILKPFDTLQEAIERANALEFGLAAGVFSNDFKKAHKAANQIKAGIVWVNSYNILPPSFPFGGRKLSGVGKDLGKSALDEFTFEKSVLMGI